MGKCVTQRSYDCFVFSVDSLLSKRQDFDFAGESQLCCGCIFANFINEF